MRGTRGSIPVPGQDTLKYGGNTTCIEITTTDGERIIIDGGSGIRQLGLEQLDHQPLTISLFLTHTHWDHIQGIPFYTPLFIPGNNVNILGAFDPVYQKDLREMLTAQMEYCYFPVRESELKANITYTTLKEGEPIIVGSATITPILLNHPVLNYGYKIQDNGKTFFFTGDYEPATNIYDLEDDSFEQYQELVDQQNSFISDFIKNADIVVMDAQYTEAEYETKKGWGHGTYDSCIALATKAKVKKLYLTHHDPTRTDDQLDIIIADLQKKYPRENFVDMALAHEGLVFEM